MSLQFKLAAKQEGADAIERVPIRSADKKLATNLHTATGDASTINIKFYITPYQKTGSIIEQASKSNGEISFQKVIIFG